MTEKYYKIPALKNLLDCEFPVEHIEKIKADCEQALAQAEAEKPKVWDFGVWRHQKSIRICGNAGWSCACDPLRVLGTVDASDIRILGNLKEIVEQGEIVVGFSVGEAITLEGSLNLHYAPRFAAALARYEKGIP